MDVLPGDFDQGGQLGQAGGFGQFAEDFIEHEPLPFHASQVAGLIVAEAQEAQQVVALEHLATGVEINAQVLAAIDINHPFGDLHLHSSQGIPDPGHRVQIHLDVAIDGHPQQSAHFLLGLGDAGLAVEGIGLDDAETPRGDVGVAGQLDDAGHSVLHPHAEHDIGVIAHLVRAQHQHLAPAHPEGIEEWLQQNSALAQAG